MNRLSIFKRVHLRIPTCDSNSFLPIVAAIVASALAYVYLGTRTYGTVWLVRQSAITALCWVFMNVRMLTLIRLLHDMLSKVVGRRDARESSNNHSGVGKLIHLINDVLRKLQI